VLENEKGDVILEWPLFERRKALEESYSSISSDRLRLRPSRPV
jgi:hypothetical protein